MVDENRERFRHIFIENSATTNRYTRPVGRGSKPNWPNRNRQIHAEQLLAQLATMQENESDSFLKQKAIGLDAGCGTYISFESEPDFALKFESLEFQPSGIELCAIKIIDRKNSGHGLRAGRKAQLLSE